MKIFNVLWTNWCYSKTTTLFLFLLASLLLFSVSCVSHTVEPISNRQSVEPISNRQSVEPISNRQSVEPISNRQSVEPISNRQSVEPISNRQSVEPISTRQNNVDITEALLRAIDDAFLRIHTDTVVAILHVSAPNQAMYEYIFGEIEHILVRNKGYNVSDRSQLDQIRTERDFQLSWEVDDTTAASIGRFVGADAVITGRIDGDGSLQRLRIRVLNTETALVMGTGSEPFVATFAFTETPEDMSASQNVSINSSPSGANVYIYDRNNSVVFHGTTPAEASLNTFLNTNYLVVLSREGYQNFEQTILNVNRRLEPERVQINMIPVPVQPEVQTTQTLNIVSNPSDANILIYNQAGNVVHSGRTPASVNLNIIVNTSFVAVISREGYVNNEQTIRVINGRLESDRLSVSLNTVPTTQTTQTPVIPPPTQTTLTPTTVREGDTIAFGNYVWCILEVSGNRALIITQEIIERKPYHTSRVGITWANCSLRAYLNDEFYNSFSPTDRARIVVTDVQNQNNPTHGTAGGTDTRDRIFLLSIDEAQRYFILNSNRVALFNGVVDWWWLRSPGRDTGYASIVQSSGIMDEGGIGVYRNNHGGVRPALWLNL
ncbi:MAG: DUF6273 domain-containing protein [Candidatus Cloacimonetes bacterium]|nr:DUF6273 domain-containing protein [Candidatus Cloacimonadota bacterium]